MNFLNDVHRYKKRIALIKEVIDENPYEWRKYQLEVNNIMSSVFQVCRNFELNNQHDSEKINRMRKLFIQHFRPYFRWGKYNRWVIDKPFGYSGDFLIIDEIYKNCATTTGVERCLDNYFLLTEASVATRNRKNDFTFFLEEVIKNKSRKEIRIMNLASGPCRDIRELLIKLNGACESSLVIDCYDHDPHAIQYAKNLLDFKLEYCQVNFYQKNALRLALTKNIQSQLPWKYDTIFSTGLFDYLGTNLAIQLVGNLRLLLKENGRMIISNYRDQSSNPSHYFMNWGGDWNLIYRREDEFLDIFKRAGFSKTNLLLTFENQQVMQYCFANN